MKSKKFCSLVLVWSLVTLFGFIPVNAGTVDSFEPALDTGAESSYLLAAVSKKRKKITSAKRTPVRRKQLGDIRTDYLSLGGGYLKYDKEFIDPEAEESSAYGLLTARIQFKVSYLMISLIGEYTKLDADYKGYLSTGQLVEGQIENRIGRVGCAMGFSYAFSSRFSLTAPYAGLEYRYWRKKGIPDGIETDERYEWFVLPVGIKLKYQLLSGFVAGVDISGGPSLKSRCTVFTVKNTDPDSEDVPEDGYPIFRMKMGWYYRGELPLEFYLSKFTGFELCPWYEYTHLGENQLYTINVNEEITSSKMVIRTYGINLSFKIYF